MIHCVQHHVPASECARLHHAANVRAALVNARAALASAVAGQRRTGCLSAAVWALEGALNNVLAEDQEQLTLRWPPRPRRRATAADAKAARESLR